MSGSSLLKRSTCVGRVGSTALPGDVLSDVVDSFTNDLIATSAEGEVIPTKTTTQRLIEAHGEDNFYESVSAFNKYFASDEIKAIINDERYPNLTKRIQRGLVFTPIEIAEFTFEFQYIPATLTKQANIFTPKLVNDAEDFYGNGIAGGISDGFCSLMPNIFGAIGAFFGALNNIENLINSLKNFNLGLAMAVLVDKLKDQVLQIINRVVENVKSIIENITIENIVNEVKTFVHESVVGRFFELKEKVMNFFSEENIQSFIKKVEGIIDYAIGLFTDPSLDDIQFLIYRFCNLGSQIENGMKGLSKPLEDYTNNYETALNTISSSSNRNTARAISAGAIRISPETKNSAYSAATGQGGGQSGGGGGGSYPTEPQMSPVSRVPSGDTPPIGTGDYGDITEYNKGKGDGRITFSGGALRPAITKEGKKPPAWRWENTSLRARARVMRIQKRFGKQLIVISARRTYQEGLKLYQNDLKKNGGRPSGKVAKPGSSKHEQGHAFDIKWSGYPSGRKEFLTIAAQEGMRGIGGYSSFVHVDEGPPRYWGSVDGVNPRNISVIDRDKEKIEEETVAQVAEATPSTEEATSEEDASTFGLSDVTSIAPTEEVRTTAEKKSAFEASQLKVTYANEEFVKKGIERLNGDNLFPDQKYSYVADGDRFRIVKEPFGAVEDLGGSLQ